MGYSVVPHTYFAPDSSDEALAPLAPRMAYVKMASAGAASEKMSRCLRTLTLSRPSWRRKVVRPKAAGALCSIIAKNTKTSTSV